MKKLKKKIKLNMIKPDIFKKKRNNIGAFIIVEPNPFEKGVVEEKEAVPIVQAEKEEKPAENEEHKEEEKKEEEKKEEEKQEINIPQDIKELNKEEPEEQSKFNILLILFYLILL